MTHSNGHTPSKPIDPCKSQVPVLGAFYKSKSHQSSIGKNFKNLIIKGDHTVQLHHLLDPLIEEDEKSQVGYDHFEIDKIIEDQLCRLYEDYYEISHSDTEGRNDSYGFPCVDFDGIFDLAGYSQSIEEAVMSGDMTGLTTRHAGEMEEDDFSSVAFMDMSNPMSRYLASHRLWEPYVYGSSKSTLNEAYTERKQPAGTDYKVRNDKDITSDHFFSYLHSESQFTESPMPGLYLHTTVGVDSSLYTVAGTRSIYSNHTATSKLGLLLKNKIRVSANGRIDFPLPLNSDILNSAVMIPNDLCYIMSMQSHVIKVIDLREVYLAKKRSRELSGRSKGEDKSVMMERGIMGMSGDALSGRYILYYGGFVLGRTVEKHEKDPVIEVSFHIKENQYIYVLDIQTFEVQRFGLYTNDHRDNYALNESLIKGVRGNRPVSFMPNRFGHTSNAVNISQRSRDRKRDTMESTATDHEEITGTLSELTAAVYIIGGYGIKYDAESKRYSFEIIDDMWKLEMEVKSKGKNESLSFADEVSASAINWRPTDDIYKLMASKDVSAEHREMLDKVGFGEPQPRAFHITELLDTKLVFGQHKNDNLFARTSDIVSSVQTELSTLAAVRHHVFFSSERKSQLKLLMHGGVNADGSVLGDFWWFDFEQEMWFRLKSYFVEDEEDDKDKQETESVNKEQEAQLRKCGHQSFVFDKYLVIIAGAKPAHLKLSDNPSSEGVTDVFTKLDRRPTDRLEPQSYFHNIFVMDIHDQKWFVYKIFHKTGSRVPNQIGHSEEAAAAAAADTDDVEFNFTYSNLLGTTTTVSNSRLVLIGGICVENFGTDVRSNIDSDSSSSEQQDDSKQIIILNNSLICMEFPLGSFSSSENIRNRKY
ncbi:hypothetical protein WICPIJ_001873 [Wickerhamomyces pijperi]|uniref:Uncharacterized protein n=1 Tax=Wickerhamomyces pijperi TaxID=599730 RepID=A0A9P8QA63_WICPI|nr:hypothetical protein WICPIJ_001873 [Wickerhamomyces pijperi]